MRSDPDRAFFLTAADAARVPDACPDARWRLIFALARWGGLRCPSEPVPLRWGDVDRERGRLPVTSPKTGRHAGEGTRTVPPFPELRPHLEAAFELAEPGAVRAAPGCNAASNLRQGLLRIVKRAGLEPWPKLFHNLRAGVRGERGQTELAAMFPIRVVCDWIGNTAAVAAEHYLTTTVADFARAAASGRIGERGAPGSDAETDAAATQIPTWPGADPNGRRRGKRWRTSPKVRSRPPLS